MKKIFLITALFFLSGCMGMPKGIVPVENFKLEKYLGTWYEIARLDHLFEKGLNNVTATYTMKNDGGIAVLNKGYLYEKKKWVQAEGKAYFAGSDTEGYFKVSFFGPFYSSYVIFDLDKENYEYAFVCGYNNSYLWLLSRKPVIDENVISRFVKKAKASGFDTDKLIFVKHEK